MVGVVLFVFVVVVSYVGVIGGFGVVLMLFECLCVVIEEICQGVNGGLFNINLFILILGEVEVNLGGFVEIWWVFDVFYQFFGVGSLFDLVKFFDWFDEQFEVVLEQEVFVVSLYFGIVEEYYFQKFLSSGVLVIFIVMMVEEVKIFEDVGVYVIIVQGFEVGGYQGMFECEFMIWFSMLMLFFVVIDVVDVLVIVVGGIIDGCGIVVIFVFGV